MEGFHGVWRLTEVERSAGATSQDLDVEGPLPSEYS